MKTPFGTSIIVATNRGPKVLENLFKNTHEESELIIIDSNYNEKTKQWLSEQEGYKQIVYSPCKPSTQEWNRDFSQSLNTAISFVENEWVVRADDYIFFKEDFFDVLQNDISHFDGKFLLIGQKSQAFNNEKPFVDYMSQRGIGGNARFVNVENPAFTYSFGAAPLQLYLDINSYDERYDVGWGFEDKDFLHRALKAGYVAMLDKLLMGAGAIHSPAWPTIGCPNIVYQITAPEIENGKIYAYNSFDIKKLREVQLKEKVKWIVK
ncbi:MAG: glycosyltransferase [Halanaerobiales bacterium]|nr:glycosyltransferase [Halanaerobiales bacterium]